MTVLVLVETYIRHSVKSSNFDHFRNFVCTISISFLIIDHLMTKMSESKLKLWIITDSSTLLNIKLPG